MTDSPLMQQAIEAYEERTRRQQAQAAEHEAAQVDLRSGLVQLKTSAWRAHAASVLYDKNQPGLVDVDWTVPSETARKWDLVDTGRDVTAKQKSPDADSKFIVTASIGDGISLVLELDPQDLAPTYEFLAVKDDLRRDYKQVSNLGDLGAAIAAFRKSSPGSR